MPCGLRRKIWGHPYAPRARGRRAEHQFSSEKCLNSEPSFTPKPAGSLINSLSFRFYILIRIITLSDTRISMAHHASRITHLPRRPLSSNPHTAAAVWRAVPARDYGPQCNRVPGCRAAWSDVGSWDAVWQMMPKDPRGNVARGRVRFEDSEMDAYLPDVLSPCAERCPLWRSDPSTLLAPRRMRQGQPAATWTR